MSAILGRIYDDGNGVAYEYLALVPATADAGDSWRWTRFKSEAHWFHFKSFEEEERTLEAHTCEIRGQRVRPWAVNGAPPASRREPNYDVAAATTPEPTPVAADPTLDAIKARIRQAKTRKATAKRNAAAPQRNERGAEAWQKVFRSRISPEQAFNETERRCGS